MECFPGLDCPGLIEATFAASIQYNVLGSFPGLDCPGLIEAPSWLMCKAATIRFPGLDCPGLIEARTHERM